jgi:hypothetical protein
MVAVCVVVAVVVVERDFLPNYNCTVDFVASFDFVAGAVVVVVAAVVVIWRLAGIFEQLEFVLELAPPPER